MPKRTKKKTIKRKETRRKQRTQRTQTKYSKYLTSDSNKCINFLNSIKGKGWNKSLSYSTKLIPQLDTIINEIMTLYKSVCENTKVTEFSYLNISQVVGLNKMDKLANENSDFILNNPKIIQLFILINNKHPDVYTKYIRQFNITPDELTSFKEFLKTIENFSKKSPKEQDKMKQEISNYMNENGKKFVRMFSYLIRSKQLPEDLGSFKEEIYKKDTIYSEFAPMEVQLCAENKCNNKCVLKANFDDHLLDLNICSIEQFYELNNSELNNLQFKLPKNIETAVHRSLLLPALINSSKQVNIVIWLCPNKKQLPEHLFKSTKRQKLILGSKEVNSAATDRQKIAIWRKEEFKKSIFHESVHYFNLDFHNFPEHKQLYNIFKINPENEIRVYESYTELLANILNCITSGYEIFLKSSQKHPTTLSDLKKIRNLDFKKIRNLDFKKIRNLVKYFIKTEQQFSCFQIAKILYHLGYTEFKDFLHYEGKEGNNIKSAPQFLLEQTTPVLSYFIIKGTLLNNIDEFINQFIFKNNKLNLKFNDNPSNHKLYLDLIIESINNPQFVENVNRCIKFLKTVKKTSTNLFPMKSLRMTCVEVKD